MIGSEVHEQLKTIARQILESRGFLQCQIYEEYTVIQKGHCIDEELKLTCKRGFIADVVGINETKTIAIECGYCDLEKLAQLKLFFDEVVWIPYVSTIESMSNLTNFQNEISRLNQEKENLERQNTSLNSQLHFLKEQISLLKYEATK
jgi:hypothetical protein